MTIRRISQKRLEREFGGKLPSSTVAKSGTSKRDEHRQLNGMGLDKYADEDLKAKALAQVEAHGAFVRGLACLVTGKKTGEWVGGPVWGRRVVVECAHIKGRGAWGVDIGNCVPLDISLHRLAADSLHQLGQRSFEKRHQVSLRAGARQVLAVWEAQSGKPTL